MSENENENGPGPPGVGAADAIRQYMDTKAKSQERLVDLLHRALGQRYGIKPDNEEE